MLQYPCFDANVTYGLAIKGLDVQSGTVHTALRVHDASDKQVDEPNVRTGKKSIPLRATLHIQNLVDGSEYVILRYNSTESLPTAAPFSGAERSMPFTASGTEWYWLDPAPFDSHAAIYYLVVPKDAVSYM